MDQVSSEKINEWRAWLLRIKYLLQSRSEAKEYYDAAVDLYGLLEYSDEIDTLYFVEQMIRFLHKLKHIQLSNMNVPQPPPSLIDYIKSIVPEFEY